MKILVFAKPGAKRAVVKKLEDLVPGFDESFSVSVKEPAEDGRANRAVEIALAEHFHIPAASVRIVAGQTARKKIVIIS
ncbi:MAG: DUF167 domain-containing protein [Minisyncoccia bacterium]|jgi:hypothetical protein